MALAQLLLSMEPKYICHKLCTMGTSSPMVPILSTEILPIPAFTKSYGEVPLKISVETIHFILKNVTSNHISCHNVLHVYLTCITCIESLLKIIMETLRVFW